MHRFELDGRLRTLCRLTCAIAMLLAGCVSPRADVQTTPIVPVSNTAASDGPTIRSAATEHVESPQIEALPALAEPIAPVAPVAIDR